MKLLDRPGWLVLALLSSLGGNVFLGGFVLGRGDGRHGPPPPPEHMLERLAERLSPADAAVLRGVINAGRGQFDADMARRRGFHDKLRAALTAEPFDPAAFEKMLADHDDGEYAAHQHMRRAMVAAAAALSPEGRRAMADMRPPGPPPPGPPPPGPLPGPPPGFPPLR